MAYADQMMEFTGQPPASARGFNLRRAVTTVRAIFTAKRASKLPRLSAHMMTDIGLPPDPSESTDPLVHGGRFHISLNR